MPREAKSTSYTGPTATVNRFGQVRYANPQQLTNLVKTRVVSPYDVEQMISGGSGVGLNLWSALVAQNATIGGALQTGSLSLGISTAAQTVNILSTVNTGAQIINIGSAAAGADRTVNILTGNATAGAQTLNVLTGTRAGTVNIGTGAAAHVVTIGSTNTSAATVLQAGTAGLSVASPFLSLTSAASQLRIVGGAATDFVGSAVLVGGTVTVANTNIAANDLILLSRSTTGGTEGTLSYVINAGQDFIINSTSGTDTSTIAYVIVRQIAA